MLKKLEDLNVFGKRVLVRVSFDIPFDSSGKPTDTFRIEKTLPTLKYLLDNKAKVIVLSKRGHDEDLSLQPLVPIISKLIGQEIRFIPECIGLKVQKAVSALKPAEILLLENVRFHQEEKQNDPEFAKALALLGDVYINDAFADSHRAHASVSGITNFLPSAAGKLMQKEVQVLSQVLLHPWRPLAALIGGIKVRTKIPVIKHFLEHADDVLLGGEIANVILRAKGLSVSKPLLDQELETKDLILTSPKLHLPLDVVASNTKDGQNYTRSTGPGTVRRDELVLDIGPETIRVFGEILKRSKMIVWAGPLGYFENKIFEQGTKEIAEIISRNHQAFKLAGGGDTTFALKKFNVRERFDFVSTGGGAMLEFLAGKKLPGVEALES